MNIQEDQITLFNIDEAWKKEWLDMPEFIQEDLLPIKSLIIHFETLGDMVEFSHLLKQRMTPNTKSIWYPEVTELSRINKRYYDAS